MEEIFWIKRHPPAPLVPAPLAIVLCPRGGSWLDDEMLALKSGGIETLVSLLEQDEAEMLNLSQEGPLAEQNGMRFLSHPIPDVSTPPDTAAFRAFVSGLATAATYVLAAVGIVAAAVMVADIAAATVAMDIVAAMAMAGSDMGSALAMAAGAILIMAMVTVTIPTITRPIRTMVLQRIMLPALITEVVMGFRTLPRWAW